jgi:SPP1 family predicted phage head-tail adaptor
VTLQKPVTTTDAEGTESIIWMPVMSTWAEVQWLGGRERLEGEQLENPRSLQVTIRNPPSTGVTAALRVQYGTRIFEVTAIVPDQEPPRALQLNCTELHP